MSRTPGSKMQVPSKAEVVATLRALVAPDATEETRATAVALLARFD